MLKAFVHASELLTGSGVAAKDGRHPGEDDLGRINDGALVHDSKKILWVGKTSELPKKFKSAKKTNLKNENILIPGLIDCHTHLVFAGDRSEEFAERCAGATYEEIAQKGGGIVKTVSATRQASAAELEKLAVNRLKEIQAFGVKTVEIKSGYGLDLKTEIKCLEVAKKLKKKFPQMTLTSTFLGAHAFPPGVARDDYMREITQKMLPEIAQKKLADACDVFIDRGYYTVNEAREILSVAQKHGLKIKIHGDELSNTESAALGAELKALSVDHLLCVSDNGIARLARSQTVAVLLPGTAFYLKAPYAPARKLIDAGACVALATDFNPGSCMSLSLQIGMTLAALYMQMSRAEIFAAVTYNAAKALGFENRKGSLVPGKDADITILPFKRFDEIYYRFAWSAY
jgi:imidazolonepropionase